MQIVLEEKEKFGAIGLSYFKGKFCLCKAKHAPVYSLTSSSLFCKLWYSIIIIIRRRNPPNGCLADVLINIPWYTWVHNIHWDILNCWVVISRAKTNRCESSIFDQTLLYNHGYNHGKKTVWMYNKVKQYSCDVCITNMTSKGRNTYITRTTYASNRGVFTCNSALLLYSHRYKKTVSGIMDHTLCSYQKIWAGWGDIWVLPDRVERGCSPVLSITTGPLPHFISSFI